MEGAPELEVESEVLTKQSGRLEAESESTIMIPKLIVIMILLIKDRRKRCQSHQICYRDSDSETDFETDSENDPKIQRI